MKRLFLLLSIFCMTSGYAEELRVTRVMKSFNLFVFENKYVVMISNRIPDLKEGDLFDIDLEKFYGRGAWGHSKDGVIELDNFYQSFFVAVGVIDEDPLSLDDFTALVNNVADGELVRSYFQLYTDTGWVYNSQSADIRKFKKEGIEWTLPDLLEEYNKIDLQFSHEIYPIYHRNNPEVLTGIISFNSKRKLFLFDQIESLALMDVDNS